MYKLIAIDIDGTLINDEHEVTEEVYTAIQLARAQGVKVVLCTGRPIGGVEPYIERLQLNEKDDFVITYNGALIQNTNTKEVVSQQSLNYDDLKRIYELSIELNSPMHFFDTERMYTPNKDISKYTIYETSITKVPLHYRTISEIPKDIVIPKIMLIDEPEKLKKTIAAIPDSIRENYALVQSMPFFYEILHKNVSKGNAVKQLAELLNIRREEVMAIGDNGNDFSMIEYAGCGVAMENAIPELKQIADYITLSNNEHGVARAIEKFVLKKDHLFI
ncbi:sugar-phosphatase [Fervidibacillus halotolerans]|uniref:Sugar-phosphatase n=1 Tax=Fervidibacillus halotolerans TaxID=2980027 RepID=A0A9E8S0M5_9BACI|nr:sugar-phosphatase [Fervidibacillus halotolerans]WAA12722.1 sugar-phosphatase [Fervidibacillus halotolerans]